MMRMRRLFAVAGLCLAAAGQASAAEVTGYVVGGTPVKPSDDQSWMASLRLGSNQLSHICGGTVINDHWVLTAAHCLVHEVDGKYMVLPPSQLTIMVGSQNVTVEDIATLYSVSHVVVHPDYSPNVVVKLEPQPDGTVIEEVISTALDNDIALLRVGRAFPVQIRHVPLATSKMADSIDLRLAKQWSDIDRPENIRVSGWGSTQTDGMGAPERLMEAYLSFVPMPECFNRLERGNESHYIIDSPLNRTKVCALPPSVIFDSDGNSLEFGPDSCKGDSGGPIRAMNDEGNWVQLGVVSGGPVGKLVCGSLVRPGFYARVGTYFSWIEANVGTIPEQPVSKPDFIEEQDSGPGGDSGSGGQGDSDSGSDKDDQADTGKCNPNSSGISPLNCNLATGSGGTSTWYGLVVMALLGWQRRVATRFKDFCGLADSRIKQQK